MAQLSRGNQLAAILLLVCAGRHYGWLLADVQSMGIASKALGAIAAICLLAILWCFTTGVILKAVMLFYGFEELQTAACSIMYLIEPWHIEAGKSMCSARIGFDIGAVGIFVVGILAYLISTWRKHD